MRHISNYLPTASEIKLAVAATTMGVLITEGIHYFSKNIHNATKVDTKTSSSQNVTTKVPYNSPLPTLTAKNTSRKAPTFSQLKEEKVKGLWVDRYSWKSKKDLDTLVAEAKKSGINTLYFQTRGNGRDSTYASTIEPNAYRYRKNGQFYVHWDPLAYLTSLAHKNGIKVEAWINVYTTNAEFITKKSGRAAGNTSWVLPTSEEHKDGYLWMNPTNPQVQMYVGEIVREIASQYDVDAIHLDRIRVPEKKFSTHEMREAITTHVSELRQIAHEEGKQLTAAVFGYQTGKKDWGLAGGGSNERFAQDGARWIKDDCLHGEPCVDKAVLMYYWALTTQPRQRSFPEPILAEVLEQYHEKSRLVLGLQTAPKTDPKKSVPSKDIHEEMGIGKNALGGFALYDYDKTRPIIPSK